MSAHPWMTREEALERLRLLRQASLESASDGSVEWLLDQVPPDAPFRVSAFDQDAVFASAADVVAFDVAIAALTASDKQSERKE
jgi:hypothetical protein